MNRRGRWLAAAGLAIVFLTAVPGLLLGENAIITYHDQLDGEMIAYILQAKHLLQGGGLPEFMGGASKTALTPPAPGCVFLFRVCSPLTAFWVMRIAGSLIGYTGMYLLAKDVTGREVPAVCAAGLYACLPFLPVYGLAQYGLPLLLWCAIRLGRGERVGLAYGYAAFYALNSSPVLVGFAVLAVLAAVIAVEGVKILRARSGSRRDSQSQSGSRDLRSQDRKTQPFWYLTGMWLILCLCYVLCNLSLFAQVLGLDGSAASHKSEYVLTAQGFWSGWLNGFLYGAQYSTDYHLGIAIVAVAVLPVAVLWKDTVQSRRSIRAIRYALCANVALTGISALWNSAAGVALRSRMGALGAFQLDRLLWLAPCLWYLVLACDMAAVWELWSVRESRKEKGREKGQDGKGLSRAIRSSGRVILTAGLAAAVAASGLQILKNSDIKSNVQKLRDADYAAMSYADYYAIGVMDQVEDFLREETDLEQSRYHVVSLGIDPAAALYHGFYCLDGYSNNYDLEYKHAFRRVIAPALEVSDYLREYYDNWGNRCYLFGSECPGYYTIERDGFYFTHLELDTEALRELGGNYLLSAAYIANAEELDLKLLREEPFRAEDSYYHIYVYEVERP
ncbi:MAG: DUF6044 family protein [Clostridium sp.]|nr:DUF6044 family protein [Acetatifactor muris]MCM1525920.1 DUF6044 family protein [Bacteroides sp.]MCM1562541.1 DUF6044 family protein [Clostridium sp.]